ncbi:MAG: hypothetical protein PVJ73_17300, partial [Acidobacteriota bacterium]
MGDERDDVAEELRRVRDEARRRAGPAGAGEGTPGPAPLPSPGQSRSRRPPEAEAASEPSPLPPDAAAVNAAWPAEAAAPRGPTGPLRRLLERLLQPRFEAQRAF